MKTSKTDKVLVENNSSKIQFFGKLAVFLLVIGVIATAMAYANVAPNFINSFSNSGDDLTAEETVSNDAILEISDDSIDINDISDDQGMNEDEVTEDNGIGVTITEIKNGDLIGSFEIDRDNFHVPSSNMNEKIKIEAKIKGDDAFVTIKYKMKFESDNPLPYDRITWIKRILEEFSMSEEEVGDILKIKNDKDDDDNGHHHHHHHHHESDDNHDDDEEHEDDKHDGIGHDSDIDGDGIVGQSDFDIVLKLWGECDTNDCKADINGDGIIGINDFLIVLAEWTEENDPQGKIVIEDMRLKSKFIFSQNSVSSTIEMKFKSTSDLPSLISSIAFASQLDFEDLLNGDEFIIRNKNKHNDSDDDHDDDDERHEHDDDDDERHDKKDKNKKRKIEVEIDRDDIETEVEIRWDGKKFEYETNLIDKNKILTQIAEKLDLTVKEIKPYVKFEIDD